VCILTLVLLAIAYFLLLIVTLTDLQRTLVEWQPAFWNYPFRTGHNYDFVVRSSLQRLSVIVWMSPSALSCEDIAARAQFHGFAHRYLGLRTNQLSGTIPSVLGNLTRLG
jgi:hypothetical protein